MTRSPLRDAEVAQHGAEQLHLGQHAPVGEGLDRVGDGRIVNQSRLVVAAGGDVTVERIVAGVAGGAGEPAAIDTGVLVKDFFWLLVPVDLRCGFRPEHLRAALPVCIDVVITAGTGVHLTSPPSHRHPEVPAAGLDSKGDAVKIPSRHPSRLALRARISGCQDRPQLWNVGHAQTSWRGRAHSALILRKASPPARLPYRRDRHH